MTTTQTEAVAACRLCGVATDQRLVSAQVRGFDGGLQDVPGEYVSGLCDDCVSLRPEETVGLAVRAALRLLGKSEADDGLAGPVFEEAGLDVAMLLYGEGREPLRKAWEHVDKGSLRMLKAAYVRVLDAKVHAASDLDRPVPPGPPPGGNACLACGARKSEMWGEITTGGLARGPALTGYFCAVCSEVRLEVGATGPSFLEAAAARHVGWLPGMETPKAWVATGLPPGEPFAWADLTPAAPDLDPLVALRIAVRDLTARVAELEARP